MANMLDAGAGGLPSPSPGDQTANPPEASPQIQLNPKTVPASKMMSHFGGQVDQTRARFDKMKEAETQISATTDEMGKLFTLGDTVTTKDVVKGCAGIVAAGVPAVQIATILADMPEQPQQLQSWVKQKYDEAVAGEQKVSQLLNLARHQMVVAGLQHVAAHSAEAHHIAQQKQLLATAPPQGSA